MFFKKSKKKPKLVQKNHFHWYAIGDYLGFQLLQTNTPISLENWADQADNHTFAGVAFLLGELELQADLSTPQLSQQDETTLMATADWVAGISNAQAAWLSLPPCIPFVLDIDHEGTLDQPDFQFRYYWQRFNGQAVLSAKRQGALLQVGSQTYRINQPYFSLVTGMEAFNAAPPQDLEARFLAWGRLSEFLPEESVEAIQTHGYLKNTKVAHATAFTLDIQETEAGLTIQPVLVKPLKISQPDDPVNQQNASYLLNEDYQQTFVERFENSQQTKSRYVLKDGWFVVVEDTLQEALHVVKKQQKAKPESRRAFAKNPRAFLRQALGDKHSDSLLESLFVETMDYSQRVKEVGLWEEKTIPWVQQGAESWIPPVEGEKPASSAQAGEKEHSLDDNQQKITLKIDDNLTELHYVKSFKPRTPTPQLGKPSSLKTTLKPHQQTGLAWLQQHWTVGSPGALLADDMGLGKTLQSLTFLVWLKERMRAEEISPAPLLIVAPTGLLRNWEEEHRRHFNEPGLGQLLRAYGKDLQQLRTDSGNEVIQGMPLLNKELLQSADWLLTTYETLRDYQHSFAGLQFAAIVFDEVQKIKTPGTLMTEAAKAMQSEFILAMTGTPIENRLADLWCIIDTVCPGYLGNLKAFSQFYEKDVDNLKKLKPYLTESANNMPAIMLRRMKEDHLTGLPSREVHLLPETVEPTMPAVQAQRYDDIIEETHSSNRPGVMLDALQQLRTICLHPFPPSEQEEIDEAYIQQSARLIKTFTLLDNIEKKQEKVLIFLDSQAMQRHLMTLIQRRYGVQPMLINGSVNGIKRQQRVNEFQQKSGFDVFIISPLAGGVGLTLTAANHVIHLSRWWNPAVEDQCTDRAYRLGQTKIVHVYYPLAIHPQFKEHSFDVRLHTLLESKRQLSREMLLPPAGQEQDIQQLYGETVGES